jgi:RNA polymerase sigma-70 factor
MLHEHVLPLLANPEAIDRDALERALVDVVARAHAAHPGVVLTDERFVAHLAPLLADRPLDALTNLRTDDLFVAKAAAEGDANALAILERVHVSTIPRALAHLRLASDLVDEVEQRTRQRLLASGDGRPRILDYAGKGGLSRWIGAVAVRIALDLLRASKRGVVGDDDALLEHAAPVADPELEHMKQHYSAEFRSAVRAAFAALPTETRLALRLYYIDGLTLDQLAALDQVAASTVSRRLASARRTVLERTREILRERLAVGERELESILQILGSRLEFSRAALDSES